LPKEAEARKSKPIPGAELEETPTELVALASLKDHPRNYKQHPDAQIEHIEEAMRVAGVYKNVVIAREGTILMGHGVVKAARRAGRKKISARRLPLAPSDPRALKLVAIDNEVGNLAERDEDGLAALLREVVATDGLLGTGLDGEQWAALVTPATPDAPPGSLAEQFLVPPFSVLDARQGYWQERKRAWLSLGIKSELGRTAPIGGGPMPLDRAKNAHVRRGRESPGGNPRPAMKLGRNGKIMRGDGAGHPL